MEQLNSRHIDEEIDDFAEQLAEIFVAQIDSEAQKKVENSELLS